MFRQCVCSLLLMMLFASFAVESAQATSSPTTTRTQSSQTIQKERKGCSRRRLDRVRRHWCRWNRNRRFASARRRARVTAKSQKQWIYSIPNTAIGDPPMLSGNLKRHRFRCDKRFLRAARQDGATKARRYKTCRSKLQRRKASNIQPRGHWETYLTMAYCQTGYTASGTWTAWGTVAATLPFGTRVYVPGYGKGTVLDRGGAVGPGQVDLYMPDCGQAEAWGTRTEKIRII